jgi:hypothetical protein
MIIHLERCFRQSIRPVKPQTALGTSESASDAETRCIIVMSTFGFVADGVSRKCLLVMGKLSKSSIYLSLNNVLKLNYAMNKIDTEEDARAVILLHFFLCPCPSLKLLTKLNSVALVRKRTIPTERPPLSAK